MKKLSKLSMRKFDDHMQVYDRDVQHFVQTGLSSVVKFELATVE